MAKTGEQTDIRAAQERAIQTAQRAAEWIADGSLDRLVEEARAAQPAAEARVIQLAVSTSETLAPSGGVTWLAPELADEEAARLGWQITLSGDRAETRQLRYPKGSLLVVAGPPGAGKSHLVSRIVGPAVKVLDPDDYSYKYRDAGVAIDWNWVFDQLLADLRDELEAGRSVVICAPALRGTIRQAWARAAAERGRQAHMLLVDADRDTCLAGIAGRGDHRVSTEALDERYLPELAYLKLDAMTSEPILLGAGGDRFFKDIRYHSLVICDRESGDQIESVSFTAAA